MSSRTVLLLSFSSSTTQFAPIHGHLLPVALTVTDTARRSDSSLFQFFYGDDELYVTKQEHPVVGPVKPGQARKGNLRKPFINYEFALQNFNGFVNRVRPIELVKMHGVKKEVHKHMQRALPMISTYKPVAYIGSASERFVRAKNPHKLNQDEGTDALHFSWKDLQNAETFSRFVNVRRIRSLATLEKLWAC
ncbi:hypothetical protein AURDEDRAFT_163583 [Auricularia subglabra TFB-10046 SS5]|nr:hypothetical protein AURDEDRAFT_163583 [Auricularia subglabra TFB-10046 SS5]